MPQITVADVHRHLHDLLDEDPARSDDGLDNDAWLRLVYHGEPACLAGVLLHHFGASVPMLRTVDRMLGSRRDLSEIRHGVRRRFTPAAWALVCTTYGGTDGTGAWAANHRWLFEPRRLDYHRGTGPRRTHARDAELRPWLYADERTGCDVPGPETPGCTALYGAPFIG